MTTRTIKGLLALLLIAAVGACDGDLLDVLPQDEIAEDVAIVDLATAEAALAGAYSALQDGDLYGGDYFIWTDALTDDVEHTGTYGYMGQADLLNVPADNYSVNAFWVESYRGINRVNTLIQKVPELDGVPAAAVDRILGQSYALRAFNYFTLVRAYGGVPLVLVPPASLEEASQVTRATVAEVYAQIEADLQQAESLLAGADNDDRTVVTPGFVDALQAKVHLYQEEWAAAEAAARELVDSQDYELVEEFGDLFEADGAPTTEDIFRLVFTGVDYNNMGYYYQYAGRFETGATVEIFELYDEANDERWAHQFDGTRSDGIQVVKYPTTAGTEDLHMIRYGEVLLILAEALAQQGELGEAVTYLNMVRTRAGLTAYDLVADLNDSQADVLDAIYLERRLELAFEGERWFDLVRTGRAAAELGDSFEPYEALLPIPESELDVAPNLTQNPGYN